MRLRELRDHVDRRPFSPFRIYMSDGSKHDVTNPNFVFLMRSTMILGLESDNEDELPDRSMYCDFVHITRVETLSDAGR